MTVDRSLAENYSPHLVSRMARGMGFCLTDCPICIWAENLADEVYRTNSWRAS